MGHKHSSLHRHLRQHDIDHRPSRDLVTAAVDSGGGGGGSSSLNNSGSNNTTPFYEIKSGGPLNFKRRLSVRNISIRRSFHVPKSKSKSRSRYKIATTDDIPNGTASSATSQPPPPIDGVIAVAAPITTNTPSSSSSTTNAAVNNNNKNHSSLHHLSHSSTHTTTVLPLSNSNSNNNSSHNNKSNRNGDKFVMERLRKSFRNSFRRKKDHIPESIKPHQWQSDEQSVKAGNCLFPVKYLGCVEVFESRGMQICEDALRRLRNSRRKATKGTLYVTGDGLRVVDDETKGLIVDQTIEKVSFCAPDRSHERGFSYICRDGTTRRWMCHGFHAARDSGERLSHAVGCAFAVCLERKQRRDKEAVTTVFDQKTATFTRTGSFRQTTITERLQDPQVAKPTEPPPLKTVHNPNARERPHASTNLLQRQGSLRGGPLNHASPFKRQLSLRIGAISDQLGSAATSAISNSISAVPTVNGTTTTTNSQNNNSTSTASQRERAHSLDFTTFSNSYDDDTDSTSVNSTSKRSIIPNNLFSLNPKVTLAPSVAPIQEVSPSLDQPPNLITSTATSHSNTVTNSNESASMITAMCQELSQGLTMLSAAAAVTTTTPHEINADRSALPPGSSKVSETFSAFDKWISTNKAPLIPPPVVDQMPQVTAPPPPTSPSYSTVTFSASEFSAVPSSPLTNCNSDNQTKISPTISSTAPFVIGDTVTATAKSQIVASNIPKSQSVGSAMVDGNSSDPFDAGWAELVNRHAFTSPSPAALTSTLSSTMSMNSITNTATTISNIPYKSTNPFLDLSQFSVTGSGSSTTTTDSIFSLSGDQPAAATGATTNTSQPSQQMFKAFEVHM